MAQTYKIVRVYAKNENWREIIKTGLTLEEAQEHCSDPETSSTACTNSEGKERTRTKGSWFDCYQREW